MSDRPPKRSRHGGDRSFQDGPDRRNRHPEAGRDRDRNRRDYRRDDDTGEHRRYRSRSDERQDRKRDFNRRRGEEQAGKPGRDRDRERGQKWDRAERDKDMEDSNLERDKGRKPRGRDRDYDRQRSASPRRSASPPRGRRQARESSFPTRPKTEKPTAPLSIKMNTDRERDGRAGSHDTQDETAESNKERLDDTPMGEDDEDDVVVDDEMDAMQAIMGFSSFGTTKGTKVAGNNVGAVRKEKKTEYRQYMNRVGGFNRPLSPTR